ncbi:MAG: aquaporin family protein [Cyclobacteriaceae bacterium]|nr:aquaporin family protein [Cyclobacteriaceae bacterium]
MSEYIAEFFGTALLILFGAGVNAGVTLNKSYAQNSGWLVISLAWGLGVTMGIYAVGRISGAHLNPAVTIGLAASGDFPVNKIPGYLLAQFFGAFAGASLVWLHYLPHWGKTDNPAGKLGIFSTGPAIDNRMANLLSEIIGTFTLLFVIQLIGANEFTQGLNPMAVGALIVAIGLSLGGTTGYAINPARDLGPRFAHFLLPIRGKGTSNWHYAWIPLAGPLLGGLQGALTYDAFFRGNTGPLFVGVTGLIMLIVVFTVVKHNK